MSKSISCRANSCNDCRQGRVACDCLCHLGGTPPYKLVRTNDPSTSHMAAAQIDPTRLEDLVLSTIRRFGQDGCISDEVRAMHPDLSYSSVTARYKALSDKDLIQTDTRKRPGDSGRQQRIMWATSHYLPLAPTTADGQYLMPLGVSDEE